MENVEHMLIPIFSEKTLITNYITGSTNLQGLTRQQLLYTLTRADWLQP